MAMPIPIIFGNFAKSYQELIRRQKSLKKKEESEKAKEAISTLYKPLYLIETPILYTDLKTAELIKYSANAFLAVKISYINQMADLCEKVGADVHDVARGMGLDKRIGSKFLHPGPGYGGAVSILDALHPCAFLPVAGKYPEQAVSV